MPGLYGGAADPRRSGLTEVQGAARTPVAAGLADGVRPPADEATQHLDRDRTGRRGGLVRAWIVLVVAGVLEAVWARALGRSEGLSRLAPSLVFTVSLMASMSGLGFALRDLPTGTAYAVAWVGIGAACTVARARATGSETVSLVTVLLILGLVGCVVGLELVSDSH